VLVLWSRDAAGVRVLLRDALRVPLHFGRPEGATAPAAFTEVVAGIVEAGEEGDAALRKRAAAEAFEEAGLRVAPERIQKLGPPMFPTPGMCAELFHFLCCEVSAEEVAAAVRPGGDGSPFEEGAHVRWVPLDDALRACAQGELRDLKTELALRRLRDVGL
jgi:ADP-ribose pyrophosphatase